MDNSIAARALLVIIALGGAGRFSAAAEDVAGQQSPSGITHSFLATGGETYIVADDGKITWRYPGGSRDGWVRPSGDILLAANKSKEYPGGAIIVLDMTNRILFEFKGTQSEVNSVQPLADGHILLTEAGPKPRLLEIDRMGKILIEFPLQCQTDNHHMQTRMARKLQSGNYLVPHLLDKVVREYTPQGKVVWEAHTPNEPKDSWPFTAIRLENGNTHINCTHGDMVIEVDKDGKIIWQLSNTDLPTPLLHDPCGAQRLANGNTIIASYGAAGETDVKLLEVTPKKEVVWTYRSGRKGGIHEVQILTTNGKPLEGPPMR